MLRSLAQYPLKLLSLFQHLLRFIAQGKRVLAKEIYQRADGDEARSSISFGHQRDQRLSRATDAGHETARRPDIRLSGSPWQGTDARVSVRRS